MTTDLVILTHPLPSEPLGQLIEEPFSPNSQRYVGSVISPTSPTQITLTSPINTTRRVRQNSLDADLMKIEAHESARSMLENERTVFRSLCQDPEAQKWMQDMTQAGRRFSFVVGTQELRNAKFSPVSTKLASQQKVLVHARKDSAQSFNSASAHGLEARRVKCLVGRHDAPHALEDVDYHWSYFPLSDDLQLAIGLGIA